jgi:hypothetical protein
LKFGYPVERELGPKRFDDGIRLVRALSAKPRDTSVAIAARKEKSLFRIRHWSFVPIATAASRAFPRRGFRIHSCPEALPAA